TPDALRELHVTPHLHKVAMKPGKPVFFGTLDPPAGGARGAARTLVFGLPGNPVSSFVCFELFVRPALRPLAAPPHPRPPPPCAGSGPTPTRGRRPTPPPWPRTSSTTRIVQRTIPPGWSRPRRGAGGWRRCRGSGRPTSAA